MSLPYQGQIDGTFTGFDGDALFKLTDGTYWLQAEYKYWYHYAYCPRVELFREHGAIRLRLSGQSDSVAVRQVNGVIESQIEDEFNGWDGESEYELTNGQVWKQSRYRYEYKYMCRPRVFIYDGSSGKIMDVDGCRAAVERIR
jgi:hypothetical protein